MSERRVLRLVLKRCPDCPFYYAQLAPHDWCQFARKEITGLGFDGEKRGEYAFSKICPLPKEAS